VTAPARLRTDYWLRRARHHVLIGAASAVGLLLVYRLADSPNPTWHWSMATAYVSLVLMGLTLSTGVWNVLAGRANPVSTDLRRDLGIWAAFVGVAHVVFGLQIHMKSPLYYFIFPPDQPHVVRLRYDLFGVINWAGLGATVLLVVLLAISNDWSLRRLGAVKWKRVQRWNYAAAGLVVLHGVGFQVAEQRHPPWMATLAIVVLIVGGQQLAGYRQVRGRPRQSTAS
jgi:sulfoxide reductase heme-binding subunit YedZ